MRIEEVASTALLNELRTRLPHVMRDQLNPRTLTRAYFLLAKMSDDSCVHQLHDALQEQYKAPSSSRNPIEEALTLLAQLQETPCDEKAPFKYRLPLFLGE